MTVRTSKLPSVLLIAMEFGPANTTGAHRSLKFAKYLRSVGYDPLVLTFHPATNPWLSSIDDANHALLRDLPRDLDITYAPVKPRSLVTRNKLAAPLSAYFYLRDDLGNRWRSAAMRAAREIIARRQPVAIHVSMPPFSAGPLAARIAAEHNLPLIVDMRDAWSQWSVPPFASYAHYALVHQMERRLFQAARAVVTVTPQLRDIFARTHPSLPDDRFSVVSNGFDGSLPSSAPIILKPLKNRPEPFRIGYVGAFYYEPTLRETLRQPRWKRERLRKLWYTPADEDWLYRSPYFLLATLRALLDRRPDLVDRVKFTLIGTKPKWLDDMVETFSLSHAVEHLGRLPKSQVLEEVKKFDLSLCTSMKVNDGLDYCLASKTFDYIQAQRPILGLVTPGAQKDFLVKSQMALVCDPDDLQSCATTVEDTIDHGLTLQPNVPFLSGYHRKDLARELAGIYSRCISTDGTLPNGGPIIST